MNSTDMARVKKVLKGLRENPVDTSGVPDEILRDIYLYLMAVRPTSSGEVHWFCDKADETTIEAATFLLRLMAYNSEEVTKWKARLQKCLEGCIVCVRDMEKMKASSKKTYLGAFTDDILQQFFDVFSNWELSEILLCLEKTTQSNELSELKPPTLYRLLTNWNIFSDERVLRYCTMHTFPDYSSGWIYSPFPPGLLIFLVAKNTSLREWAKVRASRSTILQQSDLSDGHIKAIEVLCCSLRRRLSGSTEDNSQDPSAKFQLAPCAQFWPAFKEVLRLLPPSWVKQDSGQALELRQMITQHLHLQSHYFANVFECFMLLMRRLEKALWLAGTTDGPVKLFKALCRNPSFDDLLENIRPLDNHSIYLAWFREFLSFGRDHPSFERMFVEVVAFLCDKRNDVRFQKHGPLFMASAFDIILGEMERCPPESPSLAKVFDQQASNIASVAYDKAYSSNEWENARSSARQIVEKAMTADISAVQKAIRSICLHMTEVRKDSEKGRTPGFLIQPALWNKVYSLAQITRNPLVIADLVRIVAQTAHLDALNADVFQKVADPNVRSLVALVNDALRTIQLGFVPVITNFVGRVVSSQGLDVLQVPEVGKSVVLILLSPVPGIHEAGLSLTGLAFDVDGRSECFKALLANMPDSALAGMCSCLTTFLKYSAHLPEACNLSRALVVNFSDILEALCPSPEGLLHNSTFLRPNDDDGTAARLPGLWALLTRALSHIYKNTPIWANHFDPSTMITWMRDALILARDVLKQWRVIETASNAYIKAPQSKRPSKISPLGRKLVEGLQEFLPELARWLKLTDEELLHQSFSLVQSIFDLLKEVDIKPSEAAMAKLGRYVENAGKGRDSNRSRLDKGRLLQLSEAISYFMDDEEVVIIERKPQPNHERKEQIMAQPLPSRNYILGKPAPSHHKGKAPAASGATSAGSVSSYFSDKQKKVDSPIVLPSFKRPSAAPATHLPFRKEPKNEGLGQLQQDSDSSSSSEDDDKQSQPTGLESLGSFVKSPRKRPPRPNPVERRGVIAMDMPAVNNAIQERFRRNRQIRNTALRLRPDISGLHRAILSWDYNSDAPLPPGHATMTQIPSRFENYDHYLQIFLPLLLAESWAQLGQSKEEAKEVYQCRVDARQHADDWLDIEMSILESVEKGWSLSETDIVLLRFPADNKKCIMAKVKSYKTIMGTIHVTARCYTQAGFGDPGLQISTTWQIHKVFSLSTLHREYGALVSLQYNELCGFILRPFLPRPLEPEQKDIQKLMKTYHMNEPQAAGVLKAISNEGFTLIQGPPGTGKTSTICGLISHFLSTRPRPSVPIIVGKQAQQQSQGPPTRILLCAPSNAAIDELAHRVKLGTGFTKVPNVIRVGADASISASVKDVSLDYLVDRKLDGNAGSDHAIGTEIRQLREKIDQVKESRRITIEEINGNPSPNRMMVLESEMKTLTASRQALTTKLDQLRDKQKSDNRTLDTLRRNTRHELLTSAEVICTTLAGSGHDILESLEFDMIVIDEAAQAIELSSLIPLKYGCSRCVMVGDPQQLPPTVISMEAARFRYNQSLFVRLQASRQDAVQLLSIQYRMHPEISRLPSRVFYGGRLTDGPDMAAKTKRPWHVHERFGTYRFLNVSWGNEESKGHSLWNLHECETALELYARFSEVYSPIVSSTKIGVVSMYKAQVRELRQRFIKRFGEQILEIVDFNTVDGFQGQEKDVIILSCVRSGPGLQAIGFLSDVRRMNVALTRAKSSLFILGHAPTLERSDVNWKSIIEDARSRSALIDLDRTFYNKHTFPRAPSSTLPKPSTTKTPQPTEQIHETPADLSTPKNLAMKLKHATTSAASTPQPPQQVDQAVLASSSGTRGTKRTEPMEPSKPKQSEQAPPRKRPKQQTMFIPRKKT